MNRKTSRVNNHGRAYAGSQLQIQIYVNRRQAELSQKIVEALPSLASLNPRLRWVSPLEAERFIEYKDKEFLKAMGYEHAAGKLHEFWPLRGPNWDALAIVEFENTGSPEGVILVEAKSHSDEIYSNGCRAREKSRAKIEAAFQRTKDWLNVKDNVDWTGPLYQSANRLAHLYFFRKIVRIPAWLVNIYFLNDPRSRTTLAQWHVALAEVKDELGLKDISVPQMAELFLDGKDRNELIGERG